MDTQQSSVTALSECSSILFSIFNAAESGGFVELLVEDFCIVRWEMMPCIFCSLFLFFFSIEEYVMRWNVFSIRCLAKI
jgi:hypothetical protein